MTTPGLFFFFPKNEKCVVSKYEWKSNHYHNCTTATITIMITTTNTSNATTIILITHHCHYQISM